MWVLNEYRYKVSRDLSIAEQQPRFRHKKGYGDLALFIELNVRTCIFNKFCLDFWF